MGTYKKIFIVLNVMTVAATLVYISSYMDRLLPDHACSRSTSRISKHVNVFFGRTYPKYMVYLCDEDERCGELTDRIQGMVMTYFLAKLSKRKFKIRCTSPVNLEKLMEPILVDWTYDSDNIVHGSCAVYDFLQHPGFFSKLKFVNLDDEFPEDVVYVRIKKFSWSGLKYNPAYAEDVAHIASHPAKGFYELFHDLLRLNKRMLYQFIVYKNQFKPSFGDKLICAVVEGKDGSLSPSETKALWEFLDQYKNDKKTKIAVSSTDGKLLDLAIVRYTDHFMSIPGIISSFDGGGDLRYRILDNLRQIILDFFTLIQCDVSVFSCQNDLPIFAAMVRGKNEGLHYLKDGVVKPTNLELLGFDHEKGTCETD